MTSRFQIEEMVSQDASRVVFLAQDESTGETVALRRFISADGGGEEMSGFLEAIESISQLRHPSLRAVVEGGVDPVDGVPFVANEWVEGEILGDLLENAVLSEDDGLVMVFQALDLLAAVQAHSGALANWLEFRADDVIVRETEDGPCFTFWTTLARWMGEQDGKEAVAELASLAGRCCGLSAGAAPPESRLGKWLRFVRDHEPSVAEAMGALKAMADLEDQEPAPTKVITRSPFPNPPAPVRSRPGPVVKQGSPATGLLVTIGVVVVVAVIALVAFLVVKDREKPALAATEERRSGESPGETTRDPGPEEPLVVPQAPAPRAEPRPEMVSPASDAIAAMVQAKRERLQRLHERTQFTAQEGEDILSKKGETITVTGTITEVRETTSYYYFEFGAEKEATDLCIRMAKESAPGQTLEDFRKLEGVSHSFEGMADQFGPWQRVCLLLASPEGISPAGVE